MAPARRKTRRSHYSSKVAKSKETQLEKVEELQCLSNTATRSPTAPSQAVVEDDDGGGSGGGGGCSTPRGQRYRIPETLSCPPAPKKRRALQRCSSRKISFFSPPELEVFFFFAFRGISV